MKVILIAGGAGFLGSNFARYRVECGDELHLIVRPSTDPHRIKDLENLVSLHECDLSDKKNLASVVSSIRPNVVLHCASTTFTAQKKGIFDDAKLVTDDVKNLINMLSASEELKKPLSLFIRSGSIAEYGDSAIPCTEKHTLIPKTEYAAGKVFENYLTEYYRSKLSFPIVNARIALIYGPDQSKKFLIPQLIHACLNGDKINVRQPSAHRDLIHIDDVVRAISILIDSSPPCPEAVNISTGVAPSNKEVAQLIIKHSGALDSTVTFSKKNNLDQMYDLLASPELMKKFYDWSASIRFQEGIRKLIFSGKI